MNFSQISTLEYHNIHFFFKRILCASLIVGNERRRGGFPHVPRRRSFLREESLVSQSASRDLPSAADRYWMEIVTEIVNPASACGMRTKERRSKRGREKERVPDGGENTNAAFSRQASGISALCKRNSTFLCKDRPRLVDFSRLKRTCSDKPHRFYRIGTNTDA